MAWTIELGRAAERELDKLDPQVARRVLSFLYERLSHLDDPRSIAEALSGARVGIFWKYRVGDYRLISSIQDKKLVILIARVGNRRDVYD